MLRIEPAERLAQRLRVMIALIDRERGVQDLVDQGHRVDLPGRHGLRGRPRGVDALRKHPRRHEVGEHHRAAAGVERLVELVAVTGVARHMKFFPRLLLHCMLLLW